MRAVSYQKGAPARRGGGLVLLVLAALVVVNLYVFVWDKDTSVSAIKREAASKSPTPDMPAAALPSQPLDASGHGARTDGGSTDARRSDGGSTLAAAPVGPPGVIDGKVSKSDTLGRLLKKSGLSANETDEVIRSLAGVLDFKTIRAGQPYRIERGPDGRVKNFELVVSKVLTVRSERAATGELVGKADSAQTRTEIKTIGGRIDSSLYAAIKGAGENAALVDFFVDVFAYDLDFYNDTHAGDTFRVVVEKELKDNELVRYKRILAAEYQGKAGTFRTFYFTPEDSGNGTGNYFDEHGTSSEKTLLKTPLKFQRISSGFDRRRMHPVLHTTRAHLGIDYAAPTGTPVWAAANGTISHRAPSGGAGNLVMIRHDGGIETAYMHLSKFADGQKVGQRVAAKTVIGYVGTTGLSTGPHLHFGVRQNGAYIDPSKLTPVKGKGVAAKDREAFKAEAVRLQALLTGVTIAMHQDAASAE
ncbi:MAG: M23 family metallopeptidase [Deltaproteobacteria bacterium]|nr:M23 family metallopeptidase [Deltaproteobacteria bacterium]MDQ3300219.1 M23 family metallopeptidase [Myxococcota bacterium]